MSACPLCSTAAQYFPSWLISFLHIQNQPSYIIGPLNRLASVSDDSYSASVDSDSMVIGPSFRFPPVLDLRRTPWSACHISSTRPSDHSIKPRGATRCPV